MPDISRITLPSGTTYDIKDATAREQIAAIVGGDIIRFVGVSSTEITDGGTETPIIGGEQHTPAVGDLVFYGAKEFIYTGDDWSELGDLSSLGDLALYDTIEVVTNDPSPNYVPTGSITGDDTITIGGISINAPETPGTGNYTPDGTINGNGTVTGSDITYTPEGSIGSDGSTLEPSGTYTPEGTVSADNGDGLVTISTLTEDQIPPEADPSLFSSNYTPAGTVAAPAISVATAGSTTTIKNPTKATVATAVTTAAPGASAPNNPLTYYSVSNETLSLYQIGYNTGDSITTSDVTVKTGDASYNATAPSFNGTPVFIFGSANIPTSYTFTGTQSTVTTGVSADDIASALSFSGTEETLTPTIDSTDIAAELSFSGAEVAIDSAISPSDIANALSFSGDGVLIKPGTLP